MFDPKMVPILQTDRLVLRGHRPEDLPLSIAMWADPQVVAHISGIVSTPEQTRQRMARYAGSWRNLGYGYWVVQSRNEGQYLGEVGFANWQRETSHDIRGIPEAGWVLRTSAHGQGYATEAVSAMLDWADLNLKHEKTVCMMDPNYIETKRVAEKVGYVNGCLGSYLDMPTLFMERFRR